MAGTAEARFALKQVAKQLEQSTSAGVKNLARLAADPAQTMVAVGLNPFGWQAKMLRSFSAPNPPARTMVLAGRQCGKSQASSAAAAWSALVKGHLILLLSPSLRQSSLLFKDGASSVIRLLDELQWPIPPVSQSATRVVLANGGEIVSLPGSSEHTVRGYSSVDLCIVDEMQHVSDELFFTILPMLQVSRGRCLAIGSAWVKEGWAWRAWSSTEGWEKYKVTGLESPLLSKEMLAQHLEDMGQHRFSMEYLCEWSELSAHSFFDPQDISNAFSDDSIEPLFPEEM